MGNFLFMTVIPTKPFSKRALLPKRLCFYRQGGSVFRIRLADQRRQRTSVTVLYDLRVMVDNMMESLNRVVTLVIFARRLSFVVIYNLNNINITERAREIATIKVLGFYPYETEEYIFRETPY